MPGGAAERRASDMSVPERLDIHAAVIESPPAHVPAGWKRPVVATRYHVRALKGVILAGGTSSRPYVNATGYDHSVHAKLRTLGWAAEVTAVNWARPEASVWQPR